MHNISELAGRVLNRELVRALAVLKLWNSGGPGLDYGRFCARINGGGDYDISDLTSLLRRDQKPDLDDMIRRVAEGYRFLGDMTDVEKMLAADRTRKKRKEADIVVAALRAANA